MISKIITTEYKVNSHGFETLVSERITPYNYNLHDVFGGKINLKKLRKFIKHLEDIYDYETKTAATRRKQRR